MPDGSTHASAFRGASYPTSQVFSTKKSQIPHWVGEPAGRSLGGSCRGFAVVR